MKVKFRYSFVLVVLMLLSGILCAQEDKNYLPYGGSLMRDTLPDITFQPDTTLKQNGKKKKQKKNIFYKKKSKKAYTREGIEDKQIVELFYVLKKNEEPTGYVDEIYVWDRSKAKVVKVRKEELSKMTNYKILHGPYTKYVGGKMIETGIFYVGTKHGRWELYKWDKKWWLSLALVKGDRPIDFTRLENQQPILIGKAKYYRGFQKEAQITYYDFERTKVKEVIPSEYGSKTGDYYYYLENGQILVKGHYADGKKIGLWTEYFSDKFKKQRETQYPKDQWEKVEPVIKREWDAKGTLIITDGKKVDTSKKVEQDPIKKALKRKK